jgi:hypothetical protein
MRRVHEMLDDDDDFFRSLRRSNEQLFQAARIGQKFGAYEANLLRTCFYDERLKVRRKVVPLFFIYSVACEGLSETFWVREMLKVRTALLNLQSIKYIQEGEPSDSSIHHHVGPAGQSYQLTATGLEVLQSWHPPAALQVRAWIKVMPPWLVLAGSIAGMVGAIWKVFDFIVAFVNRAHWFIFW